MKEIKMELDNTWISVKDSLPEENQIVDIWQMINSQQQSNIKGLEGSNLTTKSDYTGWRSVNYRYSLKDKGKNQYSSFIKVNEKSLKDCEYPLYKELIAENGEVTHWRPL